VRVFWVYRVVGFRALARFFEEEHALEFFSVQLRLLVLLLFQFRHFTSYLCDDDAFVSVERSVVRVRANIYIYISVTGTEAAGAAAIDVKLRKRMNELEK
jgi:hypothetical protein|tara:strand:- start:1995 stop:2294 length:300 start_codon:yes stop_codon:yes gene_type:complete